jgi:hypothetical protein
MTSLIAPSVHERQSLATPPAEPAAHVVDAVKTYGSGDNAVHALAGVSVRFATDASRRSWARPAPGSRR